MAEQSLYSVLGLPPSATELDIRVSYLHKLARIRAGLLPSDQRPSIERAYATLHDPEKRFRYDLHFAAYSHLPQVDPSSSLQTLAIPRPKRPGVRATVLPPPPPIGKKKLLGMAGSLLAASLAALTFLTISAHHTPSHSAQPVWVGR